jgi:DNA-directed RNA polymerase subunit L
MEVKVLEEKKDKIVFELKGSSHTICNALKNELYNDKHVKVATYAVKHPLVNVPKFIVETDGENPRKVVVDATKRLKKVCEKFESEFSKEVK